jgi:hypothetical protein
MGRSPWPDGQSHDVYFSGNGTLSQVLDRTVVIEALRRESRESAGGGDVTGALKTALAWSAAFWVLLYAVIRLV